MNNIRKKTYFGVICIVGLISVSVAQADDSHGAKRTLSIDELDSTVGGMTASNFDEPPSNSDFYTDNVRLDVDFTFPAPNSSVIVSAHVNGSKEKSFVVAGNANSMGGLRQRMNWPLEEGLATLTLKYCTSDLSNCQLVPSGPSTKTNLELPSNVNVVKIWFHNTEDGPTGVSTFIPEMTSVTENELRTLVDNLAFDYERGDYIDYLHGNLPPLTHSADVILEQCSTQQRMQFRAHDVFDKFTMAPNAKIRLELDNSTTAINNPNLYTTFIVNTGFRDKADNLDPDREYLHVFFVNDMKVVNVVDVNNDPLPDIRLDGTTARRNQTGVASNVIVINTIEMSQFRLANILAHEIGHSVADLGHVDAGGGPSCGTNSENTFVTLNRNVMCGTRWAGRLLNSGQCSAYYNTNGVGVKNFND